MGECARRRHRKMRGLRLHTDRADFDLSRLFRLELAALMCSADLCAARPQLRVCLLELTAGQSCCRRDGLLALTDDCVHCGA